MKNELRSYVLKYLVDRRSIGEIGLEPSNVSVEDANLPRDGIYFCVALQQSTAKMGTDESAGASNQHSAPRESIFRIHKYVQSNRRLMGPVKFHRRVESLELGGIGTYTRPERQRIGYRPWWLQRR